MGRLIGDLKREKTAIALIFAFLIVAALGIYLYNLTAARIAGIGITIHYKDGSSYTVDSTAYPLRLTIGPGLKVVDPNLDKVVDYVEVYLKYKLDWEGEVKDYEFSGYLAVIVDGEEEKRVEVSNPDSIAKDFWKTIAKVKLDDTWLDDFGGGEHTLHGEGYLKVELAFTDGSTDTAEGRSEDLDWRFKVESTGITSFSVKVSKQVSFM